MARNSIIGWIVKKLKGNMALVEDTSTASRNISANKYVVFQGVLCTADAAISQGDTLATSGAGKNLTEVTGGGFNELNDQIGTVNSKFLIRNSNTITKAISSGEKGTINTSYSTSAPSGYKLINRAFVRTDDGGYSIIVVPSLGANYVVYESIGSAPTLTGYVADIWMKE